MCVHGLVFFFWGGGRRGGGVEWGGGGVESGRWWLCFGFLEPIEKVIEYRDLLKGCRSMDSLPFWESVILGERRVS